MIEFATTRSPRHEVEAALAIIPLAKRDLITAWLWMHVGTFDHWTLAAYDHAVKALGEQLAAVETGPPTNVTHGSQEASPFGEYDGTLSGEKSP